MSTYTIINGEENLGGYISYNVDTWADVNLWSAWNSWNTSPDDLILQIDDEFDDVQVRTPLLEISYKGTLTAQLKVSNTGAFAGEETTYTMSSTPVAVVGGRYYRWTLTVEPLSPAVPEIVYAQTRYVSVYNTQEFNEVNTSSLSGTVAGRTVTHNLGTINTVQITAKQSTAWVDRAYALPDSFVDPTYVAPIPGVISKNPLTIVLRDDFGVAVDGVVDIVITGAPKVYLSDFGVVF